MLKPIKLIVLARGSFHAAHAPFVPFTPTLLYFHDPVIQCFPHWAKSVYIFLSFSQSILHSISKHDFPPLPTNSPYPSKNRCRARAEGLQKSAFFLPEDDVRHVNGVLSCMYIQGLGEAPKGGALIVISCQSKDRVSGNPR